MKALTLFSTVTVAIAIIFSAPKYEFMLSAYASATPYHLFPWMKQSPASSSSSAVLLIHVTTAISHLIVTAFIFHQRYYSSRRSAKLYGSVFFVSHLFFVLPIAMNLHHFGAFTAVAASLLNGSLLFATLLLFDIDGKNIRRDTAYFVVISTPVWFELLFWCFYSFHNMISSLIA